jgi:hypothetical protein
VTDAATIALNAHDIAKAAAGAFKRRDKLAAEMAVLDLLLRQHTRDYGSAVRTWAITPLMLRQACEARGLLDKEA